MTVAAQLLTAEDLLVMPDDGHRLELVAGELMRMPPPGYGHGSLAARLTALLFAHVSSLELGDVLSGDTGFRLATGPDTVRAPDVAFVSKERLDRVAFDHSRYFPGAPDFLAEIVSPSDSFTDVQHKVLQWLSAGAKLVLVLSPTKRLGFVYRPGAPVEVLTPADTFDASDVVRGFKVTLGELLR